MPPITQGDGENRVHRRMALYHDVIAEETKGMGPAQFFYYLGLPWDEKEEYSKRVKTDDRQDN